MQDEYHTTPNGQDGSDPNNGYFAASEATNLASVCLSKSQSFFNLLRANFYLEKIARMWSFYHGDYNNNYGGGSHRVDFTGDQGELVQLPVNHFRNIAQHILVMITGNRPSMEATAVNTDYKSLSQTYLANGILDYYMRQKGLENVIYRATEMAVVLGTGFIRMEWNATAGEMFDFDPETGEKNYEGEMEFGTLSPFDVVFDGTKESWNNEWVIVRSSKNRYDLAAKYPHMKNKIMGIPTKDQGSVYKLAMFSNDSTDDIFVYEFYHKRTEALPEGRYCLFLEADCVLLDFPLPYRDIPIYRITAGEFMGTPYGYSPMFDIYPIQEAVNSLYSTILTNQSAFGVQNLFIERGSDIDMNQLQGGLNIIEGSKPPVPINLTSTPEEIFKSLEMFIQAMETVSGVNSVARGDPQASLKSGTALALVQSMALQFISTLQDNYVKLIENVGTSLINILKDYAKTPKTVALVGKNKRSLLKEFTGDDLNSINRVLVTVGNPLSRTTAGRVQMAEQMLQMSLIKTPQEYFQVVNTGSLESMFEGDMSELLLVKRENEWLMEGKQVIAEMLDDHKLHIMEHRTVMADPELRMDPNLRQVVQDHLQQHIDMLRTVDPDLLVLTGQQPLQNPNQMQAPPNGGPPGPEGSTPPPGGNPPDISAQFQNPNQPISPGEMLTGQGTEGGNMVPGPAKPPAPFQNMPTSPDQMT